MPIRKGEDWGEAGRLDEDGPVVSTNAELRSVVSQAMRAGEPLRDIGLVGGDLAATLGSPGRRDRLYSADAQRLHVDVGSVMLNGGERHWFLSHMVARRSWWFGRLVLVANASWMGTWNIAPRAHPGDGRLDLFDTAMSPAQRWQGRRRLPHGGHVPHPDVSTRRVKHVELVFTRPLTIHLDGEAVGSATELTVECAPGALTVVI